MAQERAQERIVETGGEAVPTNHTTIIREGESSGSGSAGILMAVVLLIAVIGGIYLFTRQTSSENAKDNAIAQAANDVGNAASQVGDAAQDAAKSVTPSKDN